MNQIKNIFKLLYFFSKKGLRYELLQVYCTTRKISYYRNYCMKKEHPKVLFVQKVS